MVQDELVRWKNALVVLDVSPAAKRITAWRISMNGQSRKLRVSISRFLPSWLCVIALAAGLSGCFAGSQPRAADELQSASAQQTESCSIVGIMACKAAALASGAARATCIVSRNATGARVERCGTGETATPESQGTPAKQPDPAKKPSTLVQLTWSDNSNDEDSFVIERCDTVSVVSDGPTVRATCRGSWTAIGTVPANTTSYVDRSVALNRTYLYRIKAVNSAGSSGYTEEALFTTVSK